MAEKAMAPHSSTLAWKIPWTEEPGRLHSPWGRKESDTTEQLHFTIDFEARGDHGLHVCREGDLMLFQF